MARLRLDALPPARAPYRLPQDLDRADPLRRFRNLARARAEDEIRFAPGRKWNGLTPSEDRQFRALLKRVDRARQRGKVPETLASAERYHEEVLPIISNFWRAFEECGANDIAMVTLRPADHIADGKDITNVEPRALKKRLRNQLDRAGVTGAGGFAFFGLDFEFDANRGKAGVWDAHWHGVVAGDKIEAMESLRQRRSFRNERDDPRECGLKPGPRVFVQRAVTNIPTALSYALKGWPPHRPTTLLPDGTRERSGLKRRVPSPYQELWMLWMDQQRIDDTILYSGVSLGKNGLNIPSVR